MAPRRVSDPRSLTRVVSDRVIAADADFRVKNPRPRPGRHSSIRFNLSRPRARIMRHRCVRLERSSTPVLVITIRLG